MSKLTITNFRSNIYNIIDGVIDTGIPQTIERKGHKVKIILDDEIRSKFDNLEKHSSITCDPDLLISENTAFLFLEPAMLLPPPKNNKSAASMRKPFVSKDAELASSYLIEILSLLNCIPNAASISHNRVFKIASKTSCSPILFDFSEPEI